MSTDDAVRLIGTYAEMTRQLERDSRRMTDAERQASIATILNVSLDLGRAGYWLDDHEQWQSPPH